MKKIVNSLFIFCLFSSIAFAADYATCKKWAANILAVVCPSHENLKIKNLGTKILFTQVQENNWKFYSSNETYPFQTFLPGPGLNGPAVTNEGREACTQFCKIYRSK